jgi:non-ribosomal peptide synthetase component F
MFPSVRIHPAYTIPTNTHTYTLTSIHNSLADLWAPNRRFNNFLGATEVFHFSAARHVPVTPLSIGTLLPNVRCYVLDDAGAPVPVGEKDMLWVGGAGVSRGYFNLPSKNASKFGKDMFADDGSLMFEFGNVVRWVRLEEIPVNANGKADRGVGETGGCGW